MSDRLLPSFQARVRKWLVACLGETVAMDRTAQCHRLLAVSLRLGQAAGCTRHEAHRFVDQAFDLSIGELREEAGSAMLALAGLCESHGFDCEEAGVIELGRAWEGFDAIRAAHDAAADNVTLFPGVRYVRTGA